MSAIYEIPSDGEEEHVYCEPGPSTSGANRPARGDNSASDKNSPARGINSTNCTNKCHSVALFVHTVVILTLAGVCAYVLHVPQRDEATNGTKNSTSEMIRILDRLANAEAEMVALNEALARGDNEMINLKIALASSEAKIEKPKEATNGTKNSTSEMIRILDRLANAEAEMVALKKALARGDTEMTSLKSALATSEANIEKLKEANHPVFFTAENTATEDIKRNHNIIFTHVRLNMGGGYNPSSGVFTAPHSGLYLLTINVCCMQNKTLAVKLVAAGTAIAGTVIAGIMNSTLLPICTSISDVAVLREGDTASVQGAMWTQTGAMWTKGPHFAGVLVHKT